MIPHFKIQITELPLEKSSTPLQYCKPSCPPPYCQRGDRKFGLKTSNYIWCLQSWRILSVAINFYLSMLVCWKTCRYFEIPYKSRDLKVRWRPFSQGFRTGKGTWTQQKVFHSVNSLRESSRAWYAGQCYWWQVMRSALVIFWMS